MEKQIQELSLETIQMLIYLFGMYGLEGIISDERVHAALQTPNKSIIEIAGKIAEQNSALHYPPRKV